MCFPLGFMSSFYSKRGCCNDFRVLDVRFQKDWIWFLYSLQTSVEDIPHHITLSSLQGFMDKDFLEHQEQPLGFYLVGHQDKVIRYGLNSFSFFVLAARKSQSKFGLHFCYTFQVIYLCTGFILPPSIFPILFNFLYFLSNYFVVLLHVFYKLL